MPIYSSISLHLSLSINPYIYTDNENNYIIQNVVDGEFNRAITVAYNWYMRKFNIGFYTPQYDVNVPYPDYVIYGIGINGQVRPIQTHNLNGRYLRILNYNNVYAAILPLL